MMKSLIIDATCRAALVLVALFVLLASSQAKPEAGGDRARPHGPPPLHVVLDTNQDGKISADEIAAASDSLKTLDKNGDGELTPEEIHPPHPEGGAGKEGHKGEHRPERPRYE